MTHLADAGLTGQTGQIGSSKADEDGGFLYIRRLNCLHYRSECVSLYHHKNLSFGIIRLYLISGQGHACLTEHGHVRAALWCQMGGQMLGPAGRGRYEASARLPVGRARADGAISRRRKRRRVKTTGAASLSRLTFEGKLVELSGHVVDHHPPAVLGPEPDQLL